MTHIMIDIETMSTQADGAVLSIGLCEFHPNTGIGRTLEVRNTGEAQREIGRHFDPNTIAWWGRQSPEARAKLIEEPIFDKAKDMMLPVAAFIKNSASSQWDRNVWAKSPTFDLILMRDLAKQVDVKWPGHFAREYCVRTMLMIAKARGWHDILAMEPEIAHGALSDAVHQAEQMIEIMRRLKR